MDKLPSLEIKDQRLVNRFATIMQNFFNNVGKSIPKAFLNWKDTKATYRFISNKNVTKEILNDYESNLTIEQIKKSDDKTILLSQDTTNIDFTGRTNIPELGYLEQSYTRGIKLHSILATDVTGVPFGIFNRKTWTRDNEELGKKKLRKSKDITEKESYRWIEAIQVTNNKIPSDKEAIIIGDRESDIFELFIEERKPNVHLLVRCYHNRIVKETNQKMFDVIRNQPVYTTKVITDKNQKEQTVEVRYAPVTISKDNREIKLTCLQVVGTDCEWILLTDLEITSEESAKELTGYYAIRWKIEMYHFTLKSGCNLEKLQFELKDRIEKVLAMYSIVAIYVMELTYRVRSDDTLNPNNYFDDIDIKLMKVSYKKLYRKEANNLSMRDFVMLIGKLGGHLGRKSDGWPGVKAIWDGLKAVSTARTFLEETYG